MEDQGFSECEPSRWIRGARSVAPPCSFAVSRKPAAHGDGCVSRDVKVRASTWLTVVRHEDGSAIAWLLPLPAATYRGAFAAGTRRRRGCWLAPLQTVFCNNCLQKETTGPRSQLRKTQASGDKGGGQQRTGRALWAGNISPGAAVAVRVEAGVFAWGPIRPSAYQRQQSSRRAMTSYLAKVVKSRCGLPVGGQKPTKNEKEPPCALLLGQAVRAQSPKAKKRTASPEKEPPKRTRCAKKNRGPGPKRTGRFFSAESAVVGSQWQGWAKRTETGLTGLVPPVGDKIRAFPCQSGTRALLNQHVRPKWPLWRPRRSN